jgi:hypothetical protein
MRRNTATVVTLISFTWFFSSLAEDRTPFGSDQMFYANQFCSGTHYISRKDEMKGVTKESKKKLLICAKRYQQSNPKEYQKVIAQKSAVISELRSLHEQINNNDGDSWQLHRSNSTSNKLARLQLGRELCPMHAIDIRLYGHQGDAAISLFGFFKGRDGITKLSDAIYQTTFKWLESELESEGDPITLNSKGKVNRDNAFMREMNFGQTVGLIIFNNQKRNVGSLLADWIDEGGSKRVREERALMINKSIEVIRELKLSEDPEKKEHYYRIGKKILNQFLLSTIRSSDYEHQLKEMEGSLLHATESFATDVADRYLNKFKDQTGELIAGHPERAEINHAIRYLLGMTDRSPSEQFDRDFSFYPDASLRSEHLRGNLKNCLQCALTQDAMLKCYQQATLQVESELLQWLGGSITLNNQMLEQGKNRAVSTLRRGLPLYANDPVATHYQQKLQDLEERARARISTISLRIPETIAADQVDRLVEQEVKDSVKYKILSAEYSILRATQDLISQSFDHLYKALGVSEEGLAKLPAQERELLVKNIAALKRLEKELADNKINQALQGVFEKYKLDQQEPQYIANYLMDNQNKIVRELSKVVARELESANAKSIIAGISEQLALTTARRLKIPQGNTLSWQLQQHIGSRNEFARKQFVQLLSEMGQAPSSPLEGLQLRLHAATRRVALQYTKEEPAKLDFSALAAAALQNHLSDGPGVDQSVLSSPEYKRVESSLESSVDRFILHAREQVHSTPVGESDYFTSLEEQIVESVNSDFFANPGLRMDTVNLMGLVIQNNIVKHLHLIFDATEVEGLRAKLSVTPQLSYQQREEIFDAFLAKQGATYPDEVQHIENIRSNLLKAVDSFFQDTQSRRLSDLVSEIQAKTTESIIDTGVAISRDIEGLGKSALGKVKAHAIELISIETPRTRQELDAFFLSVEGQLFDRQSGFSQELEARLQQRELDGQQPSLRDFEQDIVQIVSSKVFSPENKGSLTSLLNSYLDEKLGKTESSLIGLFKINPKDSLEVKKNKLAAITELQDYFKGLKEKISTSIDSNLDEVYAAAHRSVTFDQMMKNIDQEVREGIYQFFDPDKQYWNKIAKTVLSYYGDKFKGSFSLGGEESEAIDGIIDQLLKELPDKFLNQFRNGVRHKQSLLTLGHDLSQELTSALKDNVLRDRALHQGIKDSLHIMLDSVIGDDQMIDEDEQWVRHILEIKENVFSEVDSAFYDLRRLDRKRSELILSLSTSIADMADEEAMPPNITAELDQLKEMIDNRASKGSIARKIEKIRAKLLELPASTKDRLTELLETLDGEYSKLALTVDEVGAAIEARTMSMLGGQLGCGVNKHAMANTLYSFVYSPQSSQEFERYLQSTPMQCPPKISEGRNRCSKGKEIPGMKSFADSIGTSLVSLGAQPGERLATYVDRVDSEAGFEVAENIWKEMQNIIRYQTFCKKRRYSKLFCPKKIAKINVCVANGHLTERFNPKVVKIIKNLRNVISDHNAAPTECRKSLWSILEPESFDQILSSAKLEAQSKEKSLLGNPGIFMAEMIRASESMVPSISDCLIMAKLREMREQIPDSKELGGVIGDDNGAIVDQLRASLSRSGVRELMESELYRDTKDQITDAVYDFAVNSFDDPSKARFEEKITRVATIDLLGSTFSDPEIKRKMFLSVSKFDTQKIYEELVPVVDGKMFYDFIPFDHFAENVLDVQKIELTEGNLIDLERSYPACYQKITNEFIAPFTLYSSIMAKDTIRASLSGAPSDPGQKKMLQISNFSGTRRRFAGCAAAFYQDHGLRFEADVSSEIVDTASSLHEAVNGLVFLMGSLKNFGNAPMPTAFDMTKKKEVSYQVYDEENSLPPEVKPEEQGGEGRGNSIIAGISRFFDATGDVYDSAVDSVTQATREALKDTFIPKLKLTLNPKNRDLFNPLFNNIGAINKWTNKYKRRMLLLEDIRNHKVTNKKWLINRKIQTYQKGKIFKDYQSRFSDEFCPTFSWLCHTRKTAINKLVKETSDAIIQNWNHPFDRISQRKKLVDQYLNIKCLKSRSAKKCRASSASKAEKFAKNEMQVIEQHRAVLKDFDYVKRCLSCDQKSCESN